MVGFGTVEVVLSALCRCDCEDTEVSEAFKSVYPLP